MSEPVRIGDAELWLGDCREILPALGKVDAVVTDPPYGVRDEAWDDMDAPEFARFSMHWIALAREICNEMAVFSTSDGPVRDLLKMLFPRVRQIIWNKPPGSQLAGAHEANVWFAHEVIFHCHARRPQTVVEPKALRVGFMLKEAREAIGLSRSGVDIAIRGKKTGLCFRWEEGACLPTPEQIGTLERLLKLNGEFSDALAEAYAERDKTKIRASALASERAADKTDVLTHRTVTNGAHPCEKPVPLLDDILASIGCSWVSVADLFMGSGTTALACIRAGKRFIGIEQDANHFATACRRIEEAYRQPDMFIQRPPAPKQEALL